MSDKQIVFSAPITATLEILIEQLIEGEIGLQDLPAPLAAFYHLGAAETRTSLEQQVRELTHECDRLYLAAAHPTERATILQQRLDDHFAQENDRFFQISNTRTA